MSDVVQWARDRREVLAREVELGEAQLRELEERVVLLQRSLLQVSGGIRVLEELLERADPASTEGLSAAADLSVG